MIRAISATVAKEYGPGLECGHFDEVQRAVAWQVLEERLAITLGFRVQNELKFIDEVESRERLGGPNTAMDHDVHALPPLERRDGRSMSASVVASSSSLFSHGSCSSALESTALCAPVAQRAYARAPLDRSGSFASAVSQ